MEENNNLQSGVASAMLMFGKKIEVPNAQTPQSAPQQQTPEKEIKPDVIKTPLGDIKTKVETPQPTDFLTMIKEKAGMEFKTNDELFERLNKLKELEANEDLIKDNVRNKKIVEAISRMPEELKAIVNAWDNGQDYTSIGKNVFGGGIDFTKPVDSIDEYKLVSHYNDVDKDDFDDMDEKAKAALINSSKKLFNADAQMIKSQYQSRQQSQNEYAEKVVASVEKSMSVLKKEFPNLTHSQLKEIETRLYENPVADLINKDGVYKESAGSSLAWMLYGKQTNEQIISEMQNKIYKEIDDKVKQRTSEELELMAQHKGDKPEKLAGMKDSPDDDLISKIKQNMNGFLRESSSSFVNKTQR